MNFENGYVTVEVIMTDKFHYQDVFQTINIPKSERHIASQAKNLFDSAADPLVDGPFVSEHLYMMTDSEAVSQSFWEFQNNDEHTFDKLVLTMIHRGLTIAIEHRWLGQRTLPIRRSLHIAGGTSTVYDRSAYRPVEPISSSELILASFKSDFIDVVANLGLYARIQQLETELTDLTDQNESNSAILASAA